MSLNLEAWVPYSSTILAGDPKTNFPISPTIGLDQRFEVLDLWVSQSHANTADVTVRIGFGLTTVPAAAALGVPDMLFDQLKMPAGARAPGIPGIGSAVGMELRITCDDPLTGGLNVNFLGRIVPTK